MKSILTWKIINFVSESLIFESHWEENGKALQTGKNMYKWQILQRICIYKFVICICKELSKHNYKKTSNQLRKVWELWAGSSPNNINVYSKQVYETVVSIIRETQTWSTDRVSWWW